MWGCPKDIQPLNFILRGGKYFNLNGDTPLHEAYNYQVTMPRQNISNHVINTHSWSEKNISVINSHFWFEKTISVINSHLSE